MRKQERYAGIMFLLIGFGVLIYSFTALRLGIITKPGPGFFPFICGSSLIIINTIWLVSTMKKPTQNEPLWIKRQWIKPLIAVAVITAYGALMEGLGYILSTLVFLLGWQFLIEHEKWKKTAVIAIVGTAAMYFLFVYLLSVPLPKGLLNI